MAKIIGIPVLDQFTREIATRTRTRGYGYTRITLIGKLYVAVYTRPLCTPRFIYSTIRI